uniref:TNP1 n=1 Tax=Antirrhinum majus TaxID=4151 RepID=Q04218_ANTMA|nr:TNP1 [Antirrhinum majus]
MERGKHKAVEEIMPPKTKPRSKRSRREVFELHRQRETTVLQSNSNNVELYNVASEYVIENGKKKRRGHTCMPKIWGQQPENRIVVSFNELGQPNDEKNTSTLAHFLGTIARNGRYCPLNYKDWRLMPNVYKEEMMTVVKARFEIHQGEAYVLESINKKWRSWKSYLKSSKFDPSIPLEQQLLEIPARVNKDQYKTLLEDWLTDETMKISEQKKESRAKLLFIHRMGKRSTAVQKEIVKKRLGRHPTRAELFKECYYRTDGSSASAAIYEAIVRMEELAFENPPDSTNSNVPDPNDDFAKVMGKDKYGQPRLYGMGVRTADIFGGKPSRATLLRQNMEYKEKYDALNAKIEELTTLIHGKMHSDGQPNVVRTRGVSPVKQSGTSGSLPKIRVGSFVVLKNIAVINEIVAKGVVCALNNIRENGMDLGRGYCQILIQFIVKADADLSFPHGLLQTVGDVLGVAIACLWPWLLWMRMQNFENASLMM